MKHYLIVITTCLLSITVFSQSKTLKNQEKASQLSKEVTELFREKDVSGAVKKLTPYWVVPMNEIIGMEEKTVKYLNMLDDRFGLIIGATKGKTELVNDFAIRETYFIMYEKSAIRLVFTYYRNTKGWVVNSFKWDDSFDKEFTLK